MACKSLDDIPPHTIPGQELPYMVLPQQKKTYESLFNSGLAKSSSTWEPKTKKSGTEAALHEPWFEGTTKVVQIVDMANGIVSLLTGSMYRWQEAR
jgi:hypothetical protein